MQPIFKPGIPTAISLMLIIIGLTLLVSSCGNAQCLSNDNGKFMEKQYSQQIKKQHKP